MRDPVVIIHECADLVTGTRAEERLREEAKRIAEGGPVFAVRARLLDRCGIVSLYSEDERAAMRLAYEELAR